MSANLIARYVEPQTIQVAAKQAMTNGGNALRAAEGSAMEDMSVIVGRQHSARHAKRKDVERGGR